MKKILLAIAMLPALYAAADNNVDIPCLQDKEIPAPIEVSACDMVSKVYGILGCNMSMEMAEDALRGCLMLSPNSDDSGLWLDNDSGYSLCYCGMTPEVSAVANFNGNRVKEFTFFFLFPSIQNPTETNNLQAAFCGTLLQEMEDLGMDMALVTFSDAIYEAVGTYADHNVNVRLVDDSDGYILVVDVIPTQTYASSN